MASRIQAPNTAFRDGGRRRQPRVKDSPYLDWIRSLPCVVTGLPGADAAHIRFMDRRFAKRGLGLAEKASDHWALPLIRQKHTEQHSMEERRFWEYYGIDPTVVCAGLCIVYMMYDGDEEMAQVILSQKGRR